MRWLLKACKIFLSYKIEVFQERMNLAECFGTQKLLRVIKALCMFNSLVNA